MTTPRALKVSNYLFFDEVIRCGTQAALAWISESPSRALMEDPHGQPWSPAALLCRAWLESSDNSDAEHFSRSMMEWIERDPQWATPQTMEWLMAACHKPKGDPEDPPLPEIEQCKLALSRALESLDDTQRTRVEAGAMGLLEKQWARLGGEGNVIKERQSWLMHTIHWIGAKDSPFHQNPAWPDWVGKRFIEALASSSAYEIRAYEVEELLALSCEAKDVSPTWVKTWASLVGQLKELCEFWETDPTPSTQEARKLAIGAAGVLCDLVAQGESQHQVELGSDYLKAADWARQALVQMSPGEIAFTERARNAKALVRLQGKFQSKLLEEALCERLPHSSPIAPKTMRF